MSGFGDRLRSLRTEKGYSQHQIAKYINVNPGLVSQWEAGKCVLRDKEKQVSLAKFLGTTYDYLMFGKQDLPQVTMSDRSGEEAPVKVFTAPKEAFVNPRPVYKEEPLVYKAEDGRKLDDLNLLIRHLRDMHITVDEKRRLHNRLSQMRTEVESVVLFGE